MAWQRYAIYWLPDGDLGDRGADWLGWDARRGLSASAGMPGTDTPRKYGFHATIKPPFRLAPGRAEADLVEAALALCAGLPPAPLGRLRLGLMGGFLALRPEDTGPLAGVAERIVQDLDRFRAPAPEAEVERRRAAGLSERQEALLAAWGYPYVLDEFRPHLTLTGRNPGARAEAAAEDRFAGLLETPVTARALSLVGSDGEGRFHLIRDLPLGHDSAS